MFPNITHDMLWHGFSDVPNSQTFPGLDVISLLTDTLCVLILLFPGENKVMAIKYGVHTHTLHSSFQWSLPKRSVYKGQPHLASTILLKSKLFEKINYCYYMHNT